MLDRLMGTETEYAIRYEGLEHHEGNGALFDRIAEAVGVLVHTRPAEGDMLRRHFTENGGTFAFEQVLPVAGGLFEAGTPECRGPAQTLLYQRAQDNLLREAVDVAQARMDRVGRGRIGLLKNCRDASGNVYGAQESYEVPVARGPRLLAWWASLIAAVPLTLISSALVLLWLVVGGLVVGGGALLVAFVGAALGRADEAAGERVLHVALFHVLFPPAQLLVQPPLLVVALAAKALAYRPYRRHAMGFLVSRCVLSGAGTRRDDGSWGLSEKMADLRRIMRLTIAPSDRGLIETGNLLKPMYNLVVLRWRAFADAFRTRQRLQLGMSDANRCDVAEYLKLGTTALVLDMVEAGVLDDAPRPRRPVRAARAISDDPDLGVAVALRGGGRATALELQRFYADRAAAWIGEVAAPLEAHHLVTLWRETLDRLEADPASLFGRLDWVTKRALVQRAATGDPDADKKIDLRYHELGPEGYFTQLDEAGLVARLVEPDAVRAAMREPPGDTPARQRGALVRSLSRSGTPARFGWRRVHLGGPLQGKVIRLDERRDRRGSRDGESSEET